MQDRTTVLAIKVHHSLGLAFYMCLVLCTFATKPICRRCWGRTQSLSQPRDLPDWRVDWGKGKLASSDQICMSFEIQFDLIFRNYLRWSSRTMTDKYKNKTLRMLLPPLHLPSQDQPHRIWGRLHAKADLLHLFQQVVDASASLETTCRSMTKLWWLLKGTSNGKIASEDLRPPRESRIPDSRGLKQPLPIRLLLCLVATISARLVVHIFPFEAFLIDHHHPQELIWVFTK